MKQFIISDKNRGNTIATIEAETHKEAAVKFLRKGRKGGNSCLTACRVTGDVGKSGMFQGYKKQGDGLNSVGENFHVTEA